ncbi:MAG: prepilin-type N-terminal cleavage/methylation domain-containing protein [Bacteroidales bacterium]|nr:prepilin-type N-terminal cleavage/methylation domain-containing protein [Bacteroidales bacterium]
MLKLNRKRVKAFSLTELLIVLAIIGILILLALPKFLPLISKTKSTEAQIQLKHLYTLEQNYFYVHSTYTTDFTELGFEHAKLVSEGGTANYKIEIVAAQGAAFKAVATAIVDFDGDGAFNVWEIDQDMNLKETVKD